MNLIIKRKQHGYDALFRITKILLLVSHEQRPTEEEEEIWDHLSPTSRSCFCTGQGIQPYCKVCETMCKIPPEEGASIFRAWGSATCEGDRRELWVHNQKDTIPSVPSSSFPSLQLTDLCLRTLCICQYIDRQNQGCRAIFNSILLRENPNIQSL